VPDNKQKDFFISYTATDAGWAEWIAWQLEKAGYSVIIQAWDFLPGGEFTMDIHNALKDCRKVLCVLTPAYMKSPWCLKESLTTLVGDVSGGDNKLVPVRVLPCKPEGLLKTRIYIDLAGIKDAEQAKKILLSKIKGIVKKDPRFKPDTEPAFPLTVPAPRFPGLVPEIWNIPLRNPHFTGRNKEITRVYTYLNDEKTTILTQAIVGLGGIGKTQLALEYAHR
jgi:hypothetical protein